MPFVLISSDHTAFPTRYSADTSSHVFGQRASWSADVAWGLSYPGEFDCALDWCRENIPSSLWANVDDTYVVIHTEPEAFSFKMRWC